jgi:hypothetical protein
MADDPDHLDEVGSVVGALTELGLEPILVGGMALVILGSRRVTRDFDFVIGTPGERLAGVVGALYDRGLELAARVNDAGDVTATLDNRRVAVARLRLDAPSGAFFLNRATGLRIDLLFDFPIPAATLLKRAARTKVRSHVFRVAAEADLMRLKTIARARRTSAGDAEDLAFLRARRARRQR